jgi:hypothetical protein
VPRFVTAPSPGSRHFAQWTELPVNLFWAGPEGGRQVSHRLPIAFIFQECFLGLRADPARQET